MDISQPFVTQEQKFKYWEESKVEIKSLRQQLSVKDLEVMQLREDLCEIKELIGSLSLPVKGAIDTCYEIAEKALSTKFTPDNLIAWHKEQLGEPVAWKYNSLGTDYITEYYNNILGIAKGTTPTPLYAPKLEIKL